jgi:hypothetical protein
MEKFFTLSRGLFNIGLKGLFKDSLTFGLFRHNASYSGPVHRLDIGYFTQQLMYVCTIRLLMYFLLSLFTVSYSFIRITCWAHFNRQTEHTVRQTGEGGEAENRRTQKYEKTYEGKLAERQ